MYETVDINFDAIIKFQNKHKYTDAMLAYDMEISPTHFSDVKNKRKNPGAAFIFGLVRAGLNPADMFVVKKKITY